MLAHRPRRILFSLAILLMAPVLGHAAERSEVPAQYKWDLTALFKSEADWTAAKEKLVADVPLIAKFEGRLSESPQTLFEGLSTYMGIGQRFERIYTYASQHFDEDTRVGRSQEMEQEADEVGQKLRTAASFVRPEIIALGKEKMEKYLAAEPRLAEYRPYLENLVRWAPHTLNADEEKLVAQAGRLAGAPSDIHGVFVNAEMPYPTVTLSDGESVRLDAQGYTQYRGSTNREDRKKVFKAFWQAHQDFRRTLGTSLYGQVKNHIFTRNVRKFDSCLEAALYNDNIPTTVYRQLIADVHANLPTLHRYLKLRARMMGLNDLGYEDLYAPIVSEVNLTYTPEEAIALTVNAVKPLGPEYVKVLGDGLTKGGWVDWIPTTGKRAGAYSTIAYGVHPYQLLNFTGNYDEVSTLAHESGHSMHSYLSTKNQPYPTYDYATFVAEVASTLNENLLFHSMLDKTKDDDTRLFLLGNYLENLRTTLFRQVLFAEFELEIHEAAERGEPLTGDEHEQALPGSRPPVLRTRRGRVQRGRALRSGVGVHQPLLLQLLRLPVRDEPGGLDRHRQLHPGRGGAGDAVDAQSRRVSGAALRGRVQVPDRSPEGGGGGHDHAGAVQRGDAGDERGDGRDGGDSGAAEVVAGRRTASLRGSPVVLAEGAPASRPFGLRPTGEPLRVRAGRTPCVATTPRRHCGRRASRYARVRRHRTCDPVPCPKITPVIVQVQPAGLAAPEGMSSPAQYRCKIFINNNIRS